MRTIIFLLLLTQGAAAQVVAPPSGNIQPVQPANPQQQVVNRPLETSVKPEVLSAGDADLYRRIFAAQRAGEISKAKKLFADVSDTSLKGYVEAGRLLATKRAKRDELVAWLTDYRELAVADKIYRAAVSHSAKRVKRGKKTIRVAVVTNIPVPSGVGIRSGGYEDAELPPPAPQSDVARAVWPQIQADIKAGQPDAALGRMRALIGAPGSDIAILSHRIAASYLAEGIDASAFALAASANSAFMPDLEWDAGFSAYRLGRYPDAVTHLEKLAQNGAVPGEARARAAFWAARSLMQMGDPLKVVSLLAAAAKEQPTFYGLVAEKMLGTDTSTGFSDPVLSRQDLTDLMAAPSAHRAVALWQVGENDHVGSELNRAFVQNNERLDPAMAALARAMGVTNVELRASEKSVSQGLLLTGLFPVPQYQPEGGWTLDFSVVLAVARIESRFQTGPTSPVGARGIMQLMPATAAAFGGKGASEKLDDPSYSLKLGQIYIAQLLDRLDGNMLEMGGAYNAGPMSVSRWRQTKAGKDDPLLFIESIPVAETRSYVRRLMEYHWMYRRRLGQDAKSLDDAARGRWPLYHPVQPATGKTDVPS